MIAAAVALALAFFLHARDKYAFFGNPVRRDVLAKTLAAYVIALQLLSTGLLADVIQRRGRML
jgi:hypothetical protein